MNTPDVEIPVYVKSKWSRRGLIFAGLMVSVNALARPVRHYAPRILFICQFGTAKSAIARELFRRRARERGMTVTAFSRGLTLEDHISPQLRQKLTADGIDPGADAPQRLSARDWKTSSIVVIFNSLPSDVTPTEVRDWTDMLSFNEDYVNARLMLDRRIDTLLDEISQLRR